MNQNDEIEEIDISKKFKFSKSGSVLVIILFLLASISVGLFVPLRSVVFQGESKMNRYLESSDFINTLESITWNLLDESRNEDRENQRFWFDDMAYYFAYGDDIVTNWSTKEDIIDNAQRADSFYLNLEYDENKDLANIESSMDISWENNATNRLEYIIKNQDEEIENIPITMIYVINDETLRLGGSISDRIRDFYLERYLMLIVGIGAVFMLGILLWSGFTDSSKQQSNNLIKGTNKIPIEIKSLMIFAFVSLFYFSIAVTANGSLDYYTTDLIFENIIVDANMFFYIIGIPLTFLLYTFIYIFIADTKNIYRQGIYKTCMENSIVGRIFIGCGGYMKNTLNSIFSFDIKNTENRKMIMALGINLIVLFFIAYAGALGMILAVVYTVFLFKYLKNKLRDINKLYLVTEELSYGEFDQELDYDLGMFTPIVENLGKIRSGFKLAVDREIKGQNLKTELISNVSHDLKTPLTSIISYVDLLKKEPKSSDIQEEYIDILDKKSQRLSLLIEDLFEASKAASGNISLNLEPIDIVSLLRQTIGEREGDINASGLIFRMDIKEEKIICNLDGKRTFRIFDNLISNILKYSLSNSRVYIETDVYDDRVDLIFKNISAYEMNFNPEDMLERFTRGDKSRNTDGSGLGLSIARSFSELQGGSLSISVDGDLFKVVVSFQTLSKESEIN